MSDSSDLPSEDSSASAPEQTDVVISRAPKVTWRWHGWALRLGYAALVGWLTPFVGAAFFQLFLDPEKVYPYFKASGPTFAFSAMFMLLIGAIVSSLHWSRAATVSRQPECLLIRETSGRQRKLARADIVSGVLLPRAVSIWGPTGDQVVLTLRSKNTVAIDVADHAAGEQLLAELGLSADQRRSTVITGFPNTPSLWMALATMMSHGALASKARMLTTLRGVPLLFLGVFIGWLFARLIRPQTVEIGTDGLRIWQRFKQQFIRYDQLEETTPCEDGRLRLRLTNGKEVLLGQRFGKRQLDGVLKRIEQARQAVRADGALAITLLDKGRASVAEWRERLKGVFRGGGPMRGLRLTAEQALEVALDGAQPKDRRLGAVAALLHSDLLDEPARMRVRVAAAATAEPKLRLALEAASAGALAEALLEEALAEHVEEATR